MEKEDNAVICRKQISIKLYETNYYLIFNTIHNSIISP